MRLEKVIKKKTERSKVFPLYKFEYLYVIKIFMNYIHKFYGGSTGNVDFICKFICLPDVYLVFVSDIDKRVIVLMFDGKIITFRVTGNGQPFFIQGKAFFLFGVVAVVEQTDFVIGVFDNQQGYRFSCKMVFSDAESAVVSYTGYRFHLLVSQDC